MNLSPFTRRKPGGSVPDDSFMEGEGANKLPSDAPAVKAEGSVSVANSPGVLRAKMTARFTASDSGAYVAANASQNRLQLQENGNHQLSIPPKSPLRSSLVKEGTRKAPNSGGSSPKSVSFGTMPTEKKVSNVSDCLTYMQSGSDLIKVRGNTRRYKRRFSLDADCQNVRWSPTNKKPHKAKLGIECIKEIRVGRNTEALRSSDTCFEELPEDCAFSILWGDDYQCLDLIASSPDEANIWVTGLMALTSGNCPGTSGAGEETGASNRRHTLRDRWLNEEFKQALCGRDFLTDKEVVKLVKKTNPRLGTTKINQKLKEVESHKAESGRGQIHLEDFLELYKDISTRPEIYFLMVRYANKDYLNWEDLQLFLETEQGILSVTKELCQNVIQRNEPSNEAKQNDLMTVDGFANFLLSEECGIFDPMHRVVCQDMTQSFANYFLASSHNTYLTEDQLKGPSSIEGYIRTLKRGCRFIEMDVWESEEFSEPVIYHGHTLTSKLPVSKALIAIKEYSFDASQYPLILKIEQHLSTTRQKDLAEALKTHLADRLYIPGKELNSSSSGSDIKWKNSGTQRRDSANSKASSSLSVTPTPESLRFKILLMGKKLVDPALNEGEVSEEDESSETNRISVRARRTGAAIRTLALCKELSDLMAPFLVSGHLKDLSNAFNSCGNYHEVKSLNESNCLRIAHTYPEEFSDVSRQCLTRVYPNAVRVDSSNLNPQEFWNFGVQIVALNYQTPGLMMDLQDGKFAANGGCGYVLKPSVMRDELGHFSPREKLPLSITPQILHLKVISGQQLPRPRGSNAKGDSADPYVVVEVFGVPSDCAEERTKTVKNDSFNPSFDESFQFQVNVPELALLRFLVLDDDYIQDDFIGQYCIPFDCLQSGYRHLTLLNNEGDPMEGSTLFVHVAVTNRRGGGKAKRRGMSVKRRNTKIHTGVKMVGVKNMDDLFKSAIIPMADSIQMKTQLENALVEWQEASGLGPAGTMRQGLRLLHNRLQSAGSVSPEGVLVSGVADSGVGGEESGTLDPEAMVIAISIDENGHPRPMEIGVIPEQLRKSFTTLESLISCCARIKEKTDSMIAKLEDSTHKIGESYEEMGNICEEAGLRGQKAVRASENFAWNIRLLKGQIEQMHKTQQEARSILQQVVDTSCVLEILSEKCEQPCAHRCRTIYANV